jgi:flagellar basal-body rod modification protein FlgD
MSTSGVGTTTNAAAQATLNSGLGTIANNYTSFLQLLTTQLKNQDPMSPMDTDQFTQQITEMTGVQQQLLSNQLLQQLVNQNQGSVTSAVNLIGKAVTANGSTAMLQNNTATFAYNLPVQAAKVTGTVTDSNNTVIWSGQLSGTGAGPQNFTWNGENTAGQGQTNGNLYTLSVTATSAAGQAITPTTTVQGTVSAVQQINGQTLVTVGSDQVPLSSVTGVSG